MSNRQARLLRRIQLRDQARRQAAGIAPAEWAAMPPAAKKAAARRRVPS